MAKQQRVTVTVKLTLNDDADLIAWWRSIPLGRRSAVVKDAMRAYLTGCIPTATQKLDSHTESNIDGNRFDQIQQDIAWMRDALNDLPGYVERVVEYVAANAAPSHEHRPPSDNDTPLKTESARRREERMKRRRW